jgi:hypothetical protein
VTADRRLQVGGWAALLVAILLPLQFVVNRMALDSSDAPRIVALSALSLALNLALLGAAFGLDGLFRSIAPGQASRVLVVGLTGAALDLGLFVGSWIAFVAVVAGDGSGPGPDALGWLLLLSSLLVGLWFFLGAAIVTAGGNGLARIGWSGMVGGGAMILATVAIVLRFGGATAGAPDELSLRDWFHLIGLFVVLYLIRTWRYVVGGRLPAPGIL